MSEHDSALHRLAERVGILAEYWDQTGNLCRTSDETRRALIAALRIDASTDRAVEDALETLDAARHDELITPVHVVRMTDDSARSLFVNHPSTSDAEWRVEITLELGDQLSLEGQGVHHAIHLPELPLGYHHVRISVTSKGESRVAGQLRIVVPPRCVSPRDLLAGRNAFGLIANLYTVRSEANWGIGDASDLGEIARWGASIGAEFVGVNPLHALLNRGWDVSPYSPVSRLFRNPIYIDVTRVPELDDVPDVRDRIITPEFVAELAALRETPHVRYEQVNAVKGLVLTRLHKAFAERANDSNHQRTIDYHEFVGRMDPALSRFATWMAIAEREGGDWRRWPEPLRDSASDVVARFAREHATRVDYHCWLQFETDRQLAEAARVARESGMRIGLYQDLAIGSSPAGADIWAFPELFAKNVALGAPPDPYAMQGQNWGLPPIDPRALRRSGYSYFIQLLRNAFRHGGALRIDHILGFFRQFWIADGMSGKDGAYLRAPTHDLFGILALESVRHNALVVGEDLGTVPPEVPPALEEWGVLSSKVMFFEREDGGGFKPSSTYPSLALATADTHDMAPIAGFWSARDIEIRTNVGLIERRETDSALEWRAHERGALVDRLVHEGVLTSHTDVGPAELRSAVHTMMCQTPSVLVGLSLDDLAGESEPVNVPGVGQEQFESWTRKMRDPIEAIALEAQASLPTRSGGRDASRNA
ncbi:MAG TPA: 4-alpha-glucanotransferase [Gemmatimonadaceae bacterium]|jgi:4-alpha-glucanotransferase